MESSPYHIASIREQLHGLFGLARARCEPDLDRGLNEAFNNLAFDLFRFQYHSNQAYRLLCDARLSGPDTIERWQEMPVVTTVAFKDFEFSCLPSAERTHVFHSSGTTEHRPSRHFHNAVSLQVYEASLLSGFRKFVAETEAPAEQRAITILSLTPSLKAAPHSSLVHMFDTIVREGEFGPRSGSADSAFLGTITDDGSWAIDFERARAKLDAACSKGAPVFLFGTAFLFVHLIDYLEVTGLHFELPAGSCMLETGGYKGRSRAVPRPELHSLICERFRLAPHQILCEYGMCELSSQAYSKLPIDAPNTCDSPRIFQFPPWARAQVISPETGLEAIGEGETGLLRIFDLANVWSVCAIQTEDLAIRRGTGFELIGRGRTAEPRGCSIMAHADP